MVEQVSSTPKYKNPPVEIRTYRYRIVKNFGGKKFGEIVFLKHWQKKL